MQMGPSGCSQGVGTFSTCIPCAVGSIGWLGEALRAFVLSSDADRAVLGPWLLSTEMHCVLACIIDATRQANHSQPGTWFCFRVTPQTLAVKSMSFLASTRPPWQTPWNITHPEHRQLCPTGVGLSSEPAKTIHGGCLARQWRPSGDFRIPAFTSRAPRQPRAASRVVPPERPRQPPQAVSARSAALHTQHERTSA